MHNLTFLCRMLASATHEMQNILAIIKESGALAGDVLNLNGPPRMKHGDKLFSALETLEAQVERGRTLMMALNTCAHAAAAEYDVLELSVFCDRTAVLADRIVRLRECSLKLVKQLDKGRIRADGFDFIQTAYRAVELVLAGCRAGDELTLALQPAENGQAVLRVASKTARAVPQSDAEFDAMTARIGAQARLEAGELRLTVPLASGE
ncbi:MAG: hypothetical protein LBI88_02265 [Deltaproteobacteria bacterium]|jgi:hypothetical protein|nr:hypothetical protein [Deltaproteobacteria bacterium]